MPDVPHLEPGTLLGVYRVNAWVGAGGMGEVYGATDTKLSRSVALKILSPEFGQDPAARGPLSSRGPDSCRV